MRKLFAAFVAICIMVLVVPFSGARAEDNYIFCPPYFSSIAAGSPDNTDTLFAINAQVVPFQTPLYYDTACTKDAQVDLFVQVTEFSGLTKQVLTVRNRYLKPVGSFNGNMAQELRFEFDGIDRDHYFYEITLVMVVNGPFYRYDNQEERAIWAGEFNNREFRSPSIERDINEYDFYACNGYSGFYIGHMSIPAAKHLYGNNFYKSPIEAGLNCRP